MSILSFTRTVIKNLCSSPATRRYPFVTRPFYKHTRGKISISIKDCIFCGMCQRRCPTGALTVVKADKKWSIDRMRCTACGCCVEVCPKKCLTMENHYSEACIKRCSDTYQDA